MAFSPSVFTMDHVIQIEKLPFAEAKAYALDVVNTDTVSKPGTKAKATNKISTITSKTKLMVLMTSWILAHPSENLKVI